MSYSSYIIACIQPLSTIILYNIYITTKSCCQISLLVDQSTHYWNRLLILVWHEVRLERKVQTQVMLPIDRNGNESQIYGSNRSGLLNLRFRFSGIVGDSQYDPWLIRTGSAYKGTFERSCIRFDPACDSVWNRLEPILLHIRIGSICCDNRFYLLKESVLFAVRIGSICCIHSIVGPQLY
jgi:hypothetical protein